MRNCASEVRVFDAPRNDDAKSLNASLKPGNDGLKSFEHLQSNPTGD
jgi:hypothetical protein